MDGPRRKNYFAHVPLLDNERQKEPTSSTENFATTKRPFDSRGFCNIIAGLFMFQSGFIEGMMYDFMVLLRTRLPCGCLQEYRVVVSYFPYLHFNTTTPRAVADKSLVDV